MRWPTAVGTHGGNAGSADRGVRSGLGAREVLGVLALVVLAACGDESAATATLTSPAEGASVAGAVPVVMAADGITIEPAGETREGFGHFHVIADAGCVATGTGIGKDADHVHFGKGQTDGVIYLGPGEHELCLQVGDGAHGALDISDRVTIDVGITSRDEWCAVIGEVDEMLVAVDEEGEFATVQLAHQNAGRLVDQLSAGLDHVDAAARDDVAALVGFAATFTTAFTESSSLEEVELALEPLWEESPEQLPGTGWVRDACGVDVED